MEYRRLGRTGVTVSSLCLGAMMFGEWGTRDHEESIKIIHRALDAGINFIDTADVYSAGESEVIVGKALAGGRRDDIGLPTFARYGTAAPVLQPAGRRLAVGPLPHRSRRTILGSAAAAGEPVRHPGLRGRSAAR